MKNALIRILCLSLILALCIPMVACDQLLSGGLLGKLFSQTFQDLEVDLDTSMDIESALSTLDPDDFIPNTEPPVQTDPPTYDIGYPTEPETTGDPIVDAPTTEIEYTTEPETTEPPIPEPVKVIAAMSWDALIKKPSEEFVFHDGNSYMTWEQNPIVNIDHLVDSLYVFGWFAFYTETEGTIGYSINGGEVIYNPNFTVTAEQGVQDHIAANVPGAKSACRMMFDIPVADLAAGTYTFALVAKDADGNEEIVKEFQVIKTLPYVEIGQGDHYAFDALILNDEHYVQEGAVQPGLADLNYTVTITPDQRYGTLVMRGWSSFESGPAVEYGYYVGDEIVILTDPSHFQDRPDLEYAGLQNGTGFKITVLLSDIPAGVHPIGIIAKLEDGTYVQLYSFYLKVVPETEQQTIDLGVRDAGGPFKGMERNFGQKLPLGSAFLEQVKINALASYADGNKNTWVFRIWQWDTDYSTTVSGELLFELYGENHMDNSDFVVDIPIELMISGDVYYELTYLSGAGGFTGWAANSLVSGVESYVGGQLQEGTYASSVVVGIAK